MSSSDVRTYLKEHEATVEPLYKDYSIKFWELSLSGDETREKALIAAKERYVKVYNNKEEFTQVLQWKKAQPGLSEVESRELKLIHDTFVPNQVPEPVLLDIVARETHIENLFNTFRANFEGDNASDNQLRDILKSDQDVTRRQAAWEASKQVGRAIAPHLLDLIRIRNREARNLGYADYYSMMFELQELDLNWVFSLFDRLEQLSDKAFTAMKSELDATLKTRFGVAEPANYPWLYSDPFFQEYPAAGGGAALDEIFRDQDIEGLTRAHYRSIGMDIDDLLGRADLYEKEGKSQHAFCLDVDHRGDVRVLCNIRKNERWMSTMLHEFGHAVYDKFNDPSLPFLLRTPAHILSTEAIAMLNGRMSKSPTWLASVAGLSKADADRVSSASTKALRSEMLIFLRWAITFVRFERELYRDPEQDLNSLWWTYVSRFQKVTPPSARNEPDWASKIHLSTSPAYYQNYVLGELMASQLWNHIRTRIVKSEAYAGYPEVGAFLIEKVFKPGARYEWNDMLKRATGEQLSPEHFIGQFVNVT